MSHSNLQQAERCKVLWEVWLLHHFIIGRPENDGEVVDHRDGVGLNNVRPNVRVITYSGNSQNVEKRANTTSKYRNVCFNAARKRWVVSVKKVQYGLFPEDQEEAAGKLADKAIITVYGADAKTNGLLSPAEKDDVLAGHVAEPVSKTSGLPKGVFSAWPTIICWSISYGKFLNQLSEKMVFRDAATPYNTIARAL